MAAQSVLLPVPREGRGTAPRIDSAALVAEMNQLLATWDAAGWRLMSAIALNKNSEGWEDPTSILVVFTHG